MNINQTKLHDTIEELLYYNKCKLFNDLPFRSQKLITALFIRSKNLSAQWDYLQEAFDSVFDQFPSFILSLLENEKDYLDPASELCDELIRNLVNICADPLDELFTEIDIEMSQSYNDGKLPDNEEEMLDNKQRRHDMKVVQNLFY